MRKAKNDPGLQVGDKIIIRHSWTDETGAHTSDEFVHTHTVTKVNSRSFYTEGPLGETGKALTQDRWDYFQFHKEGDVWIALQNHGRNW